MRTFIKTIRTITAVLMILAGLTVLFILDNANDLITLLTLAVIMVTGVVGGIAILVTTYPELTDLSEFEGDNNSIFDEYDREIEELRAYNLLLIDRYVTFKAIIRASKYIDESNKEKYPNLYRIIYEEDLRVKGTRLKEATKEELDRFKEIYN